MSYLFLFRTDISTLSDVVVISRLISLLSNHVSLWRSEHLPSLMVMYRYGIISLLHLPSLIFMYRYGIIYLLCVSLWRSEHLPSLMVMYRYGIVSFICVSFWRSEHLPSLMAMYIVQYVWNNILTVCISL